jgi:MFS family permease
MVPSTYRRLLAIRATRIPLLGVAIGRLPLAAGSLATILFVRAQTGSFAVAGAVEACAAIAAGISLPIQGRVIDRVGQTRVLTTMGLLNPVADVVLVIVGKAGAGPVALCVAGAFTGITIPALSASMRTLWSMLVPDAELRQSAFALDAVLLELIFIVGPLTVSVLVAVASPTVALLLNAALAGIGTAIFAGSRASRAWRGDPQDHGLLGPAIRSRKIHGLFAVEAAVGAAVGAMEVAATAFASQEGSREIAGALIAVQAGASLVGGLWYGSRARPGQAAERYPLILLVLAVCFLPLAFARSLGSLFPLMALSGFAFAPSSAVVYMLIDELTPPGAATESTSLVTTALVAGVALGNAVSGAVVGDGHASRGFAAAAAAAVLGCVFAYWARPGWLRP